MNPTGKGGFGDHPEHRNNDGKPKTGQSLTDIAKKYLDGQYGKIGKLTRKDLFIARCYDLAIHGNHSFARLFWNYIDGMPVQKAEISTPDEHPFELIITDRRKKDDESIRDRKVYKGIRRES